MYRPSAELVKSRGATLTSLSFRLACRMVFLESVISGFSPGSFATALVGATALRVYDRRPRGFVNPSVRLLVAKSQVPGGGLGVFTEQALPAGTTLGAYPGRLLYMAEYSRKLAEHPRGSTSKTRPVWPGTAHQTADWPMLAEAWGSLRHDLALTAASGAPAGRSLRHPVLVVGTGAPARTAGRTPTPT